MAPEHLVVDEAWQAEAVRCAGAIFIGGHTAQVAGDYAIGSNHVLPTGGAARFRGGLSAADFVRIVSVQRLTARGLRAIAPTVVALATAEGLDRPRAIDPGEGAMTGEYERPTAAPGGLRLHLNENTAGCSPRVLAAIQELTGEDIAFYPDYADVERDTAAYLGVPREQVVLTNGLDEGIFVAVVAAARETVAGASTIRPEVIVPLPAFDMYGVTTRAVGGLPGGGDAGAGLRPAGGRTARGNHPAHAAGVHHEPEQPDRRPREPRRDRPRGSGAAGRGAGVRGRGVPRFLRRHRAPADREPPERHRRPHLRQGTRAGGTPRRMPDRASGHARADPADRAAVQPERLRCRRICAPRSPTARGWRGTSGRWSDRATLIYELCARLGLTCWTSGANFVLLRVGDRAADVVAKLAARGIFIRNRSGEPGCEGCVRITAGVVEHTAAVRRRPGGDPVRRAVIDRQTTETQIRLALTIEGRGRYEVSTGIRFLDHMLELFARHGAFDLSVAATGDLDVDQHHTVEDLGIALGEAVSKALGDRRGINRAGYFLMPMDETLGLAAIDLGGRPHAAVDLKLRVKRVGDLQAELLHDFFEGFAIGARANVHVKVLYGRSSHHHVEAVFKAFARALRVACSKDRQLARALPSTKGLI